MERDNVYGYFMVKLIWRLSGVVMEKHRKSNYQTISILIYYNLHKKYHSLYCLHSIYITSRCYEETV